MLEYATQTQGMPIADLSMLVSFLNANRYLVYVDGNSLLVTTMKTNK
jgi:hypothetical protein